MKDFDFNEVDYPTFDKFKSTKGILSDITSEEKIMLMISRKILQRKCNFDFYGCVKEKKYKND